MRPSKTFLHHHEGDPYILCLVAMNALFTLVPSAWKLLLFSPPRLASVASANRARQSLVSHLC